MKNNLPIRRRCLQFFCAIIMGAFAQAQTGAPFPLGNDQDFANLLFNGSISNTPVQLQVSAIETFEGIIVTTESTSEQDYFFAGTINGHTNATFSITNSNGNIEGHIILDDENKGYKYTSGDSEDVFIEQTIMDNITCVDLEQYVDDKVSTSLSNVKVVKAPILNSLPGATPTIYLDFDGERVSGTSWQGGATIDARAVGYSNAEMERIWKLVAEDFSPFNVNVTTDRQVFDAAPRNQRMMNIFTTTTTAAPGSGGVAYLNSFARNNNDPCWTFNGRPGSIKAAAETCSHEVGHTLGLSHDGQGSNTYYQGDGTYCPIMGGNFRNAVGHWSRGEYTGANQNEDDLALITRRQNFPYKNDDHGEGIADATDIVASATGIVSANSNKGVIETNTDTDVFKFETSGGNVSFSFKPAALDPNLNIQARIFNASAEEVASSSPTNRMDATINQNLPGGAYYIQIDGVAGESSSGGYTNYGSIGVYTISGSYTPGNSNQAPVANFTGDIQCDVVAFKSTSVNTVTSYLWNFGDGNTSTQQDPTHTYQASGTYTVSLRATNSAGSDTKTSNNFVTVESASLPNGANATVCTGESENVQVSGSTGYVWYDRATNGNIVTTGNTFNTAALTQSTTLYVAGTTDATSDANAGSNFDAADGGNHAGGFYLVFDAAQPFLLKQAKVSAQGAGNRTLELRNAAGDLVNSKVINIPDGESVIDINMEIAAGADQRIGFAATANLFRSNTNLNYPYTLNNVVSIKSSTATSNPVGFYYYLFNWKISTLGKCETSGRTPVRITLEPAPATPTVTLNQATGQLSTATSYSSYQWFRNGTAVNGATSATYVAPSNGDYIVEVSNATGCTIRSAVKSVTALSVSEFIKDNFKIFPNPATNNLTIVKNNAVNLLNAKIHDVNGRLIKTIDLTNAESRSTIINVSELASGLYFMNISTQQGEGTLKLVKQ